MGQGPGDPAWRIVERLKRERPPLSPGTEFEERLPASPTPTAQREAIASVGVRSYAALCVWVIDPAALLEPLSSLTGQGMPLLLLGRDVPECGRNVYCGPDEGEIGGELARVCAEMVRGASRTIGLLRTEGDALRAVGFRRGLTLAGGFEVLREVNYTGRELESGQILAAEVARYPRMGGWVLLNDAPLRGSVSDQAIVPAGAALVYYTGSATMLGRVRISTQYAAVCPDFERMLRRGLWSAGELAQQTRLQTDIETVPLLVVTNENLGALERGWEGKPATQPAAR